jgi:tetratricopeptide (TPR) repeat protein
MKALALAVTLSLTLAIAAIAQDSKPSPKSNGASRQPAEAAANIDVAAIQKKIDEYTAAIKNDPKNDKNYGIRGQNFQRLGKLDLALSDFNRAIELNPKRQAYFVVRGNLYAHQKRFRETYADYTKAIECGPVSQLLLVKQGDAALQLGEYDKAFDSAKNAQKLKEDDAETLVLLGSVELMKGMTRESVKHLTRAIELNPSDGGAFSIRADAYAKLGQADLAKQDKAKARKLGFLL